MAFSGRNGSKTRGSHSSLVAQAQCVEVCAQDNEEPTLLLPQSSSPRTTGVFNMNVPDHELVVSQ